MWVKRCSGERCRACLCEPAASNTPPAKTPVPSYITADRSQSSLQWSCSMLLAAENLSATCKFDSMFKSRLQIAAQALVIAALSASAAAQNPQAPIGTLTDLEAALQACWVRPPMDRSRPGMQITVLMSFKRSGELFEEPKIIFHSKEASEAERSAYRIAVAETLKRCASLPFTEALGNAVAGQPLTMTFIDDREQLPDSSRAGSRPGE